MLTCCACCQQLLLPAAAREAAAAARVGAAPLCSAQLVALLAEDERM
jgi:hypothetical protein